MVTATASCLWAMFVELFIVTRLHNKAEGQRPFDHLSNRLLSHTSCVVVAGVIVASSYRHKC